MGRKLDAVATGSRVVTRVAVSGLWGAVAVAMFSQGQVLIGLAALAYIAYLLLLGGRWLIW